MGMDDLSYLEQLMGGGAAEDSGESTGGIWVVSPDGAVDDEMLRLVGKARVAADGMGAYVYLLLAGGAPEDAANAAAQEAIKAGADQVLLAGGVPAVADLVEFFGARSPQAVLFPRTRLGRVLGPGLAQALNGSLCGYAADLAVDPMYQRIVAHKPVLDDAARQVVNLLKGPAVVVMEAGLLPAAFVEPWRTGQVQQTGLAWGDGPTYELAELERVPVTVRNAKVIVGAGRGLRDAEGFALARGLAQFLGGAVAGDVGALDMGWIDEESLIGLTGHSAAPKLYLALGIEGDTEHLSGVRDAGTVVAVQPDPTAPITQFADWNVLADPAEFAQELLKKLEA